MMSLTARLCALCAACALMQMALGDERQTAGLRMLGGLLMLHLVVSGARELCTALLEARNVMEMYEILIG